MSRKPVPAQSGERSRVEVTFDKPQLLPQLFGEYDSNILALEERLGVYIHARGQRVVIEGSTEAVAHAREVLQELQSRVIRGEDIDTGLIDAVIAMSSEPMFTGIVKAEIPDGGSAGGGTPPIMIRTRKKTIVPRSVAQTHYMRELVSNDMIFALGPAGTGKTYLAVAQAVAQLITGTVQRLILSRPAVEAGERLGFLPGDMKEKVDPYLRPIYDALYDCLPAEQVERRIASGEIEIAPIAFMRGRTLADAFVILDEAQNTTPAQMKMFLTRFGANSRMVICGDPKQVDLPGGPPASGLTDAINRLDGVDGIAFSWFTAADVVRHPIVGRIVQAYEGPDA
jgi:phosphate starvation-inducible protein PhoH and related proteins